MNEYKITPEKRNIYRSFPIRITDKKRSTCCGVPTILVQSMEGGFVTRNCPECGKHETLSHDEFISLDLLVVCPRCKKAMLPETIERNYSYVCKSCNIFIRFADLLPHWSDI